MLSKIWGAVAQPSDQETPKASAHNEKNPFDLTSLNAAINSSHSRHSSTSSHSNPPQPARTPTLKAGFDTRRPHSPGPNLLSAAAPALTSVSSAEGAFEFSRSPPKAHLPASPKPASKKSMLNVSKLPEQQINNPAILPDPPEAYKSQPDPSCPPPSSSASLISAAMAVPFQPQPQPPSTNSTSSPPAILRGKLVVKLIEARNLNAQSSHVRPYVVATFDQNEFISREPTTHDDVEVRGAPIARTDSKASINKPPPVASRNFAYSRTSPPTTTSAYNPVWKHEVTFDVTKSDAKLRCTIYDRTAEEEGREEEVFLGTVEIAPKFVNGAVIDQWFHLKPRDSEHVTGDLRLQICFERSISKRTLRATDFEFLRMIGKGTFGRVFQVRKKDTKRIYAMKVLSKKEIIAKREVAHTIGERKILATSSECPFLLGLKFSFQSDTELYFVMDFKSGGELFHHLQREGRFTEARAMFYCAEIVLAFEHLHKYNICYRDLKPENILLDATGHICLCDFGLSKPDLPSDGLTSTFCGTTEYLAPEVLLDDKGYSYMVDFWSLGVLLFEMCCGWSPFYSEDTQQMYRNICFGKIKFPRGVIGDAGKQFVKGLLNRNPLHRLGSKGDAAELKAHPFFASIDWDALMKRQVPVPFKPHVVSDESVDNFSAEFTEADLLRVAPEDVHDDIENSDAWLDKKKKAAVQVGSNGTGEVNGQVKKKRSVEEQDKPKKVQPQQDEAKPLAPAFDGASVSVPAAAQPMVIGNRGQPNPRHAAVEDYFEEEDQDVFQGFSYSGESWLGHEELPERI